MEQHEVVVVGGGPVGLSLALGLARRGVDVLVLEKDSGTAEHSRAPAIWSGTQEILARLGVLGRFEEEGLLLPRIELWDADVERVLLRLPIEELSDETQYARLLVLPQSKTEHLLYEAIRETTGAEVRFSSEVVGFRQDVTGVEVRYRIQGQEKRVRGRFVAGCDGARSITRGALRASLEGITYDMQAALADLILPVDDRLRSPRLSLHADVAVAIRMDERLWRLILPFSKSREQRSLEERVDEAARNLFPRMEYEVVWKSEFRLHRRISSRWVEGRVVLAGDTAHLNSPVGGEGMNAGIMDADALTSALGEALQKDDASPLEEYARQRQDAIEGGVNAFTDRLTRLLMVRRGHLVRPLLRVVRGLLSIGPVRRRVLRRVAMLTPS